VDYFGNFNFISVSIVILLVGLGTLVKQSFMGAQPLSRVELMLWVRGVTVFSSFSLAISLLFYNRELELY
jgi:hypothetical protein